MDDEVKDEIVEKFKTVIFFVAPYGVAIGSLYLWGYWSVFKVNILQFAGFADVVASALFPIALGISWLAVGMVIGELYSRKTAMIIVRGLPPTEARRTFLAEHGRSLFSLYIVLCILYMTSDWPQKWQIFPLLVSWPIVIYLVRGEIVVLPHVPSRYQMLVVFMLVWLIPWAYGRGDSDGKKIRSGAEFSYVVSATAGQEISADRSAEAALRYIGHVGEFDFFYEPVSDAVSIAKIQRENLLTIRQFQKGGSISVIAWLSDVFSAVWRNVKTYFVPSQAAPGGAPGK